MNSTTAKLTRGRPRDPNALVFHTVGLTREQWEWLTLWMPEGNRTDQVKELFDRARKFWPKGPAVFR